MNSSAYNKYGIKPFDGESFNTFEFRLKAVLEEHDCLCVIESEEIEDTNGNDYKKKNALCKSIIIQSINDKYLYLIEDCNTGYKMLQKLKCTFQKSSLVNLKRKMNDLKFDESSSKLNEHFLRFDTLVKELKSSGYQMKDKEIICDLLMTLPKSYDCAVSSLETLMCQQEISLDFVKGKLLDEEVKRSVEKPLPAAAFSEEVVRCPNCNECGHVELQCPNLNNSKDEHEHIAVKVEGQDGNFMQFKITKTTPLQTILMKYCQKCNLDIKAFAFLYDDERIKYESTPATMKMKEGSEINIYPWCEGGCDPTAHTL